LLCCKDILRAGESVEVLGVLCPGACELRSELGMSRLNMRPQGGMAKRGGKTEVHQRRKEGPARCSRMCTFERDEARKGGIHCRSLRGGLLRQYFIGGNIPFGVIELLDLVLKRSEGLNIRLDFFQKLFGLRFRP